MRARSGLGNLVVTTFVVVAWAAASARPSPADVVHLEGGGRLVGVAEEAGDIVRVRLDTGTITVRRARVTKIERTELPRESFERRLAALAPTDADGALALAASAERDGLADEAGRALARAAAALPADRRVADALRRWKSLVRRLPDDPEADARLAALVGAGARIWVTPHFRIAHDVSETSARRRGEAIEDAYRKVLEASARIGFAVVPVESRIDVLLFADHGRWVRSLDRPEEELRGLSGLFEPRTGRIHLFDLRTMPEVQTTAASGAEARRALDGARAEIEEDRAYVAALSSQVAAASRPSDAARRTELESLLGRARSALRQREDELAAAERRLAGWEREIADHTEAEAVSTATHEACHAVAFRIGVSRPGQPMWLLEGLATMFEGGSRTTFLPEAPNALRLADLRAAWDAGHVTRLEDVVTDATFLSGPEQRGVAYAEAWALTWFLAQRRPEALARLVAEGREAPCVAASSALRLEDFRACVGGDVDALEREWRAEILGLRR